MLTGIDCTECGKSPREGYSWIGGMCKSCLGTYVAPPTQLDRIEAKLDALTVPTSDDTSTKPSVLGVYNQGIDGAKEMTHAQHLQELGYKPT